MKKVVLVFVLIISIFAFGCGNNASSSKEQAQALYDKYVYSQTSPVKLFLYEGREALSKYKDWSIELEQATIGEKQKLNDAYLQLQNEKINDDVVSVHKGIGEIYKSFIMFLDYAVQQMQCGRQGTKFGLSKPDVYRCFERGLYYIGYHVPNEIRKLKGEKPFLLIKNNGQQYFGNSVSNVNFAITKIFVTEGEIGENYFLRAKPVGKFIIVKVLVENLKDRAITVDSHLFHLIDKENRQYKVSSKGQMSVMMEENNDAGFLVSLNPRMKKEFKFVFDVPKDMKEKDFQLEAKGGFIGKSIKLDLEAISYPEGIEK